jgi:phenylalanine-4-hydroxylase
VLPLVSFDLSAATAFNQLQSQRLQIAQWMRSVHPLRYFVD